MVCGSCLFNELGILVGVHMFPLAGPYRILQMVRRTDISCKLIGIAAWSGWLLCFVYVVS